MVRRGSIDSGRDPQVRHRAWPPQPRRPPARRRQGDPRRFRPGPVLPLMGWRTSRLPGLRWPDRSRRPPPAAIQPTSIGHSPKVAAPPSREGDFAELEGRRVPPVAMLRRSRDPGPHLRDDPRRPRMPQPTPWGLTRLPFHPPGHALPPGAPSPGRSGRRETRWTGNTPLDAPRHAAPAASPQSSGGDDRGSLTDPHDRRRMRRTGRLELLLCLAALAQSSGR